MFIEKFFPSSRHIEVQVLAYATDLLIESNINAQTRYSEMGVVMSYTLANVNAVFSGDIKRLLKKHQVRTSSSDKVKD